MIYRNKADGTLLTTNDVINKFPNTSFPAGDWNQQVLDFAGVEKVELTEKTADTELQYYVDGGVENIGGVWTQVWKAVDKYTPEELQQIEQGKVDAKWNDLRTTRNLLLVEMDNAIARSNELVDLGYEPYSRPGVYDRNFILEIMKYKEELRNLPENTTDINNVVWPVSPWSKEDHFKSLYETSKPPTIEQLNQ